MTKYIICKPRGGMIDIFSLISMTLKYAEKFNRILVIDTSKSLHFKDGFNKYFIYQNKNIYNEDINLLYEHFKNESLLIYSNKKDIDFNNFNPFIHKNDDIKLNIDYSEDIILFGNNNTYLDRDIIYFFNNFTIKPIISNVFINRFNLLPTDYVSVHVRNTDHKSDIPKFIKEHYNLLKDKNIFLATDDINAINQFKNNFEKIYKFTNIVESNKKLYNKSGGIHFIIRDDIEHEKFNIDTITDFLLLASSNEYYFSCKKSGFSNCAKILFDEKNIIKNIILLE
jgi:hypothetical protein